MKPSHVQLNLQFTLLCIAYKQQMTNTGFILTAKTCNMTNRTLLCTAKIIHYIFLEIRKKSGKLAENPKAVRRNRTRCSRRARALHTQA